MRRVLVLTLVGLSACVGYRDGVFTKADVRYRIGAPDETQWRPVSFADNDLAWLHSATGHVMSTNATCHDHGDPSLDVLTTHLLFGFSDRDLTWQKAETLDGRESLHSKFEVKLDGVETEVETVVLKKNGCVHDFSYVSPRGQASVQQAAFDALVAGFAQEKSP